MRTGESVMHATKREEERQSDIARETASQTIRLWREVWESGQEYLKNYAKDLEIVAYMIEGSVRLSGFGGLACSLRLTTELLKSFWGELLPTPDEEGIETTLRPISRLNGDVIVYPLMRVPMTEDTTLGTMVVWQYGQAKQLETLSGDEQERPSFVWCGDTPAVQPRSRRIVGCILPESTLTDSGCSRGSS